MRRKYQIKNIELARSVMQESAVEAEELPHDLLELLTAMIRSWSELEQKRLQCFSSTKE